MILSLKPSIIHGMLESDANKVLEKLHSIYDEYNAIDFK
jgi:hypothetical protein